MTSARLELMPLPADAAAAAVPELATLLHACVHAGASVSFVLPYTPEDAASFWRGKVLPGVRSGALSLWAARVDGRIAGSVQLDTDTPPNQPHRAEVRKLLVHPDWRRQGIARRLMREVEAMAVRLNRSLLTLDTRTGDAAEPLYAALGYQTVGVIPGFARDPIDPAKVDGTTIMYKQL